MQRQTQSNNLYDQDFNAWIYSTVEKLKSKKFDELDLHNVIEEIEELARKNNRELFSRLKVLLAHLLKWQYQPEFRVGSWRATICDQRQELDALLLESPSLKNKLDVLLHDNNLFKKALRIVLNETQIEPSILPTSNPYTKQQVLDESYYPN